MYDFYLDFAPSALELYELWKKHNGWRGTRLRSIGREGGEIRDVPDGLIFPILAALSAFAIKTDDGWQIRPPDGFTDDDLIDAAKSAYQELAGSSPTTMGKSKACYAQLYQIVEMAKRLSRAATA